MWKQTFEICSTAVAERAYFPFSGYSVRRTFVGWQPLMMIAMKIRVACPPVWAMHRLTIVQNYIE